MNKWPPSYNRVAQFSPKISKKTRIDMCYLGCCFFSPNIKPLILSYLFVIVDIMRAWGWFREEIWKQFVKELCNCIYAFFLTFHWREEDFTPLLYSGKKIIFSMSLWWLHLAGVDQHKVLGKGPFYSTELSEFFHSTLWKITVVLFQNR